MMQGPIRFGVLQYPQLGPEYHQLCSVSELNLKIDSHAYVFLLYLEHF